MGNDIYVTETPYELFYRGDQDIISVDILLGDQKYKDSLKYDMICFHATQAVEKFLKGFIRNNNGEIEKTHNLKHILAKAESINSHFSEIKKECILLNEYTPSQKYNMAKTIENSDIDDVLAAMKKVFNFEPIQQMRTVFMQNENYPVIPGVALSKSL